MHELLPWAYKEYSMSARGSLSIAIRIAIPRALFCSPSTISQSHNLGCQRNIWSSRSQFFQINQYLAIFVWFHSLTLAMAADCSTADKEFHTRTCTVLTSYNPVRSDFTCPWYTMAKVEQPPPVSGRIWSCSRRRNFRRLHWHR